MDRYSVTKTEQHSSSDRCLIFFFLGVFILGLVTILGYHLTTNGENRYMFVNSCPLSSSPKNKAFMSVIDPETIKNCTRKFFVRHHPTFIISRTENNGKVVFEIYPKKYHRWWRDRYIGVLTCIAVNAEKKGYKVEIMDNYSIPFIKIIVQKENPSKVEK